MTQAPHEAAPAATDQTVPSGAVTRVSSANGCTSAPAPTETVRGPQNGTSDLPARLQTIRATAEDLTDLCPEHLRQGIRHLQRNCDIECNAHGDEDPWLGCNQPGRYDGDRMAAALASIPRLLAAVESVLAYGVDRENYTDTGNPEADKAIRSYAYHVRRLIDSALEVKP